MQTGIQRIRTLSYNHPGMKRNTQRLIKKPKPNNQQRMQSMRMWGVDSRLMCRKHLLGEHLEMHMFIGAIQKGISIQGYIDKGLVEVHNITLRHNELAKEMERRSYHHHSPLDTIGWDFWQKNGEINIEENKKELTRRCAKCRERITLHETN